VEASWLFFSGGVVDACAERPGEDMQSGGGCIGDDV
jgi:hypothetical protein